MIRAAFLLILTLTVATGESATLVCQALCDGAAVADADACHHGQSTAPVSLTNDADCTSVGLPAMAAPRVELTPSDSDELARVAVSNESAMTAFGRLFASTVFSLPVGSPPRTVPLRI